MKLALPKLAAAFVVMSLSGLAIAAGTKAEKDEYVAEIKSGGECKANAACTVVVTVTPKGSYHVNKEYPHKFKLTDPAPDGVTYAKTVLTKDDAALDEKKVTFTATFTPTKAGTVTIGGKIHLGVCADTSCIEGRQELAIDVTVK